jgi:4-hydroxy-3-polyprenylbenzoate decarboxylase
MKYSPAKFCIAMTGASGIQYALRLLQCLVEADENVYILISTPAQIVIDMETDLKLPARASDMQKFLTERYQAKENQIQVFGKEEWTAPIASGSGAPDAMVVCPCTTGTLAAIACGTSNNLIERAADVMIKESKSLIIVPRESPFSAIHLENMLKLARIGVTILPPNPGFYYQPKTVEDIIDFVVARILDHLHVEHHLIPRWGIDE